jgi:aminoglycoside phosphotransferase (APT) family kinase protein
MSRTAPGNVAVDQGRIESWLDQRGIGSGPVTAIEALAGGTQNIVLRIDRGGASFVLRRPPLHKRANSDATILREARILAAIDGTAVPHPRLLALETDESVVGSVFYVCEWVDGCNLVVSSPPGLAADPEAQRRVGFSLVEALVPLSALDPDERGLGDFGKWDGWGERQVSRWRGQLHGYADVAAYGETSRLPSVGRIEEWLEGNRAGRFQRGLIHGDFHFGNILIHRSEPRVSAVVDWELSTIGDPLLDLGHLLASWPTSEGGLGIADGVAGNLPTTDELIDWYARSSDRDLADLGWFRVLACYRLAVVLEGTYVRSLDGKATAELGTRLHQHAVGLVNQANDLIDARTAG